MLSRKKQSRTLFAKNSKVFIHPPPTNILIYSSFHFYYQGGSHALRKLKAQCDSFQDQNKSKRGEDGGEFRLLQTPPPPLFFLLEYLKNIEELKRSIESITVDRQAIQGGRAWRRLKEIFFSLNLALFSHTHRGTSWENQYYSHPTAKRVCGRAGI